VTDRIRLDGWKQIAAAIGRSVRWCAYHRRDLPVFFLGSRACCWEDELVEWQDAQRYRRREPRAPTPSPAGQPSDWDDDLCTHPDRRDELIAEVVATLKQALGRMVNR